MLNRIKKRCFKRLPIAYYPYKRFMHHYKCIFIHIPKNAGSSVLTVLNDSEGRKHAKWYDFYESNDYFFKKYIKFAIVREPTSRLLSAYNYCIQGGNHSPSDIMLKKIIEAQASDFEMFIQNVLTYDFMMIQPLFLPQYLYVFDREKKCQVDSLLKYENLTEEWQVFSSTHNLPQALPWTNKSSKTEDKVGLSATAQEKIKEMYYLDFELLGY